MDYAGRTDAIPVAKTFLSGVFMWMGLALSITALVSWMFASNPSLMNILFDPQTGSMNMMGWIVMLAPLGLVLLMSMGFQKLSASSLVLIFIIYSALMGMSLSFIFMVYTLPSIASTFVITAAMFGFMGILGYTTKTDLTKFGSIMMMGLVGIIIASVVNLFMQSETMQYVISFIGVLVFTGLTAYDVQKLKRIGSEISLGTEVARKVTIMGALTLYLDFINLFLFLLRFFGNRK
ncbi:MAG: Bax inhibitor-1/YccA family protein [Bacteroidetes bacterium]|nr:Bax inhibitor-1/YccA family protein [Bacteroidota bacterium]